MDSYFVMKPQKRGQGKYILICCLVAFLASFLPQTGAGFVTFFAIAIALVMNKSHMIVVYEDSLIDNSNCGRLRLISKVTAEQIHYYRKNILGEISLHDFDGHKLLYAESNMENFDRFEQWLAVHKIEHK